MAKFNDYLAHVSKDNSDRKQSIKQHLDGTAEFVLRFFKRDKPVTELERLARLTQYY